MKITKAKARVLCKAASDFVMISEGFSGQSNPECINNPIFDKKNHIENLLKLGLLEPGLFANQFICTDFGKIIFNQLPPSFRWKPTKKTVKLDENNETSLV